MEAAPAAHWIEKYCDEDSHSRACTQPWTVVVDGQAWTIATDGYRCVAIMGHHGFEAAPEGKVQETFRRWLAERYGKGDDASLQDLKAWVGPPEWPTTKPCECEGKAKACRDCDGDGEVTCNMGHDHDCDTCGGTGGRCIKCDEDAPGTVTVIPDARYGMVHIFAFNLALLGQVLEPFTAPEIVKALAMDHGLMVSGTDWFVLLMGVRGVQSANRWTPTPVIQPAIAG